MPEAAYWLIDERGNCSVEGWKDRWVERRVVMGALAASLEG